MEEVYDALSQAQKHIMLKNGGFEFDTKQSSCCGGCGHSVTEHLEYVDCCLSKELCLCDRFLDTSEVTIPQQKQGKLPKKEQEQKDRIDLEDNKLNRYIQQLAKM